jgi:hypothetical protein
MQRKDPIDRFFAIHKTDAKNTSTMHPEARLEIFTHGKNVKNTPYQESNTLPYNFFLIIYIHFIRIEL